MASPVAVLGGSDTGAVGEFMVFDGSSSYDPDGTIFRWKCSFGDGAKTQGKGHPGTFGHAYRAEGTYRLQFTVTDNTKRLSSAVTRTITIGEATDPPDPDTVPDAFTFAEQAGVGISTACTSNTITVAGITAASAISITGGTYKIDSGSYVSTAGTVTNGQTVTVRVTAASTNLTTVDASLVIGGVVGVFRVTTEAAVPLDTTPDAFGFQAQTGAATATVITSNEITITGINTTVPVSISGSSGEYSKNGAAFTTSAGTAVSGDRVRVKLTTSGSADTAVSTTLTVGEGTGVFTVRTAPAPAADGTPDAFSWPTITGQPTATVVTSSSITISGINVGVDISVAGGGSPAYSINGGAFTSSPGTGTVSNGNTIRVRLTSSATQGATLTATVTIGGVVGLFSVTTQLVTPTGTTYYVDGATGSDSDDGLSLGNAFATIAKGVSVLRPGDECLVRAGTYAEALLYTVPAGVSWTKKVRVANYNGETVWMAPTSGLHVLGFAYVQAYIEFDGINLDGSDVEADIVKIYDGESPGNAAHHIRLQNAEIIRGAGQTYDRAMNVMAVALSAAAVGFNEFINLTVHGGGLSDFDNSIYLESPNNLVEYCEIYDGVGAGVQIYNGNNFAVPSNNVVRNNIIRDFTRITSERGDGIILGGGTGNKIYNNLIYNIRPNASGSAALHVFDADNTEVYNNTVYGNVPPGILVEQYSNGTILRNNISYNNPAGNYVNRGSNTQQSPNLFGTNPLFVSAGSNFALTALSPARNAGQTIPFVTTDITGLARPQGSAYDIGAYEYDE